MAYTLLFILSSAAFMWLLKTPILFDEVFGVFRNAQLLASNPIEVVRTSIVSSWLGWQQGRFISPILHILGNLGFLTSYEFGSWSGIDQLTSYGIFRVALTASVPLLIMNLVYRMTSIDIPASTRLKLGFLAGILLPVVVVSNGEFNSPRSAPWAYTGALVLALVFTIILVRIAKSSIESSVNVAQLATMSVLGILFGSTYELTQAFAPAAFSVFVFARLAETNRRVSLKAIISILRSANSIVFVSFYLTSTLAIRGISYLRCLEGCYAPANVQIQNLNPWAVFERITGALPLFSLNYWEVKGKLSWHGESPATEVVTPNIWIWHLLVAIIFFGFICFLLQRTSSLVGTRSENAINVLALGSLVFGLAILFFVSLGFQSSQAVQDSPLDFGQSSRDSLYLSVGVSMALFSLVILLNSMLSKVVSMTRRSVAHAAIAATLAILAYAVMTTNAEVTRVASSHGPNYLLSRISNEITSPDLSDKGDSFRCDLVKLKLSNYPEWEGHDRLFVSGIYATMQARHGVAFCSLPEDSLFEGYGANGN
jgi:hypothetical protein